MGNLNIVQILVGAAMLGLIPAVIAYGKGHNFFGWWLFGWALFIVALPASIIIKPNQEELDKVALSSGKLKQCPYCKEMVKSDATVCKHCRSALA